MPPQQSILSNLHHHRVLSACCFRDLQYRAHMVTGNNFVISDNALHRENLSSHGIDTLMGTPTTRSLRAKTGSVNNNYRGWNKFQTVFSLLYKTTSNTATFRSKPDLLQATLHKSVQHYTNLYRLAIVFGSSYKFLPWLKESSHWCFNISVSISGHCLMAFWLSTSPDTKRSQLGDFITLYECGVCGVFCAAPRTPATIARVATWSTMCLIIPQRGAWGTPCS